MLDLILFKIHSKISYGKNQSYYFGGIEFIYPNKPCEILLYFILKIRSICMYLVQLYKNSQYGFFFV